MLTTLQLLTTLHKRIQIFPNQKPWMTSRDSLKKEMVPPGKGTRPSTALPELNLRGASYKGGLQEEDRGPLITEQPLEDVARDTTLNEQRQQHREP